MSALEGIAVMDVPVSNHPYCKRSYSWIDSNREALCAAGCTMVWNPGEGSALIIGTPEQLLASGAVPEASVVVSRAWAIKRLAGLKGISFRPGLEVHEGPEFCKSVVLKGRKDLLILIGALDPAPWGRGQPLPDAAYSDPNHIINSSPNPIDANDWINSVK